MIRFSCFRRSRPLTASIIAAPVSLLLSALARGGQQDFPPATALEQGLAPDALVQVDELVATLVDQGEVVGAELLIIQGGRTVLHSAHGWRDEEAQVPMQPDTVFCVRSMTKPLVGLAVHMLLEEDLLELDDRVSAHLPAYDAESTRDITVEQLLTHTGGLPMSLIAASDPRKLESVRAVADLGGGIELEFEPGTEFRYSDQGTDTLTALIEVVTGKPAEDFIAERILTPLGMTSSACLLPTEHPLRARSASKYAGDPGSWRRYWSPEDEALFPCFLGSQALYSTALDYARFLQLFLDRGRAGGERLLGPLTLRKALRPGPHRLGGSSGYPGVQAEYGRQMQLWLGEDEELVAFGHTGSDGTHAWAFPEQDALALYFTQSRGTTSGQQVEQALAELFLGTSYDPIESAPPLDAYLGHYWEGEGDLYRSIVRDGEGLALEVVGRAIVPLDYIGEDRWRLRPEPVNVIAFDRDEEGRVIGFRIGEHVERRLEPSSDLPSAAEVAARVAATHRVDLLESLGPLYVRSKATLEKLELTGETLSWYAWPDRWRTDEVFGEETTRVAAAGGLVLQALAGEAAVRVEGQRAGDLNRGNLLVRFGDWREHYPTLTVIQRLPGRGAGTQDAGDGTFRVYGFDGEVLVVRAGDTSAPAATFYVDAATGRLGRVDEVTDFAGTGRMGRKLVYRDFRSVEGILLPHILEMRFSNNMIGTFASEVVEVELGAELAPGLFTLEDG